MTQRLKIAILAPIASADVAAYLDPAVHDLPAGYIGAPLIGVLIGELLRQGHEVVGITVDYRLSGRAPVVARGPGFDLHILPGRARAWRFNGWRPGRAWDAFRFERRALAATLAQVRPDVVHAHWTCEFALAALDTGLPTVVTAHDSAHLIWRITRSPYRWLRARMARRVLARAPCLTTVSDYLAQLLAGQASAPPRVVPNPVAPWVIERGAARDAPRGLRVAMVGNGWGPRKNAQPALRAFALLRQRLPGAELHLFGHDFGPGEAAQRWAAAKGLDNGLQFHGALPHRSLIERLNGLDVLLHPALEESFGVVLAEAMALGLPLVAGARSGAVPWVAGDAQWLVDVQSPAAMAQAIEQSLTDVARYASASKAGRARVLGLFAPAAVVGAYLAHYRRARAEQTGVVPP